MSLVGATIEPGLTSGNVTDEGLASVLSHAKKLAPGVDELDIEETFVGLRPMTREYRPILGKTDKCDNVYIAGGYNNYGILLAPKAGKLIGDLIIKNDDVTDFVKEDRTFLKAFSPNRQVLGYSKTDDGEEDGGVDTLGCPCIF
ncbi:hypothetical protein ACHAXR_001201 [Thalassiosira sp. AJA248-18]